MHPPDGSLDAPLEPGEGSEFDEQQRPVEQAESIQPTGQSSLPDRLRRIGTRVGAWAAFAAMSALFLRPILIAPIIGDDFVNPWYQFPTAGTNLGDIFRYAIDGTNGAGHFNYLGQIIGTYLFALWTWMMADLGIRYTAIYAVTKLIVYLLTVAAVACFVRTACDIAGRSIGVWRSRLYVAVPLFCILQVHLPWSHDPVANYPTSGFASAAIGFLVMRWGLIALHTAQTRPSVVCGVLGIASILYYEINVACVVALVPVLVWAWHHHGGGLTAIKRLLVPSALVFALPAVATVVLQWYAKTQRIDYSGTDLAIGGGLGETFRIAFLGTLPGAAWNLSREFLNGPIAVRGFGTGVLALTAAVGFSLVSRRRGFDTERGPVAALAAFAALMAALMYWVTATLVQAATAKVQNEITRIGAVYNYYAIGTAAIAAMVVLLIRLGPRKLDIDVIRIGGLTLFIAFASVQYMVNQNISDRFQDYTIQNRRLHAAFSDSPPMAERCAVLTEWEAIVWPEYVEVTMIDGLQQAFDHFHGEPFCEGFVRSS